MKAPTFLALLLTVSLATASAPVFIEGEPTFLVPKLTQVRNILTRLETSIITTIISRAVLPTEPDLYDYNGYYLFEYIQQQEDIGYYTNRYAYGSLEYPFTFTDVHSDKKKPKSLFPPGRFHQDSFTPNKKLTDFYLKAFIPLIRSDNKTVGSTSPFYHLSNTGPHKFSTDIIAKYSLDYTLLTLLSHRASIGKVVAESKYAAAHSSYTPLIKKKNRKAIRKLLTNPTQEQAVLNRAASASKTLASAWRTAQGADASISSAFVKDIQEIVAKVFRELIDVTKEVEIEYLLQRLD